MSKLAVTNRDELGSSPDQTILLDTSDSLLHGGHVSLVVPWLDLQGDDRLGYLELLTRSKLLSSLGGFLLVVSGNSLLLDSLSLGIVLLVVGTKEVNVLVVLLLGVLLGSWSRRGRSEGSSLGKGVKVVLVRSDLSVPSGRVRELGSVRGACSQWV